jgi:hypothetical protein
LWPTKIDGWYVGNEPSQESRAGVHGDDRAAVRGGSAHRARWMP